MRSQAPTWIQNAFDTVPEQVQAAPTRYQVILEPTQQNWLFGLDYPFSQQPDINITSNFTLSKDQPVTQQLRYDVLQFAPMRIDPILTDALRRVNLALPPDGNPQTRALAKQLFAQSGSDPVRYMAAFERWINRRCQAFKPRQLSFVIFSSQQFITLTDTF